MRCWATGTTAAAIIAAAEAVTTASAEAVTTAAEPVSATETIVAGKERIELVLSEPIPLVASPSATTSVKTHISELTFDPPHEHTPGRVDDPRLGVRKSGRNSFRPSPAIM